MVDLRSPAGGRYHVAIARRVTNDLGIAMRQQPKRPAFERMEATLLACPRCRRAVPVRKRLLIVLPEGDKYEYVMSPVR